MAKRLLSGVQPTGDLHIGNYFGALEQFVRLQDEYESYVFIADLHALNQIQDAGRLRTMIRNAVLTYLAIGLDPHKVALFQQSAVPAHAELSVILGAMASVGALERAHAYKDALAKGRQANLGLFSYPVLMAADILLYKPEVVPVGKDQQQHLEMTVDLAERFNHHFGEVFPIPQALVREEVASVPGTDGQKMSKSYGNVIGLFDPPEVVQKKVMGMVTDSKRPEEPKDPDQDNLFALHRLVSGPDLPELERRYREGGIGYKESKDLLAANLNAFLHPFRDRRAELEADPAYLDRVLAEGAEKARQVAEPTLVEAKQAVGLA